MLCDVHVHLMPHAGEEYLTATRDQHQTGLTTILTTRWPMGDSDADLAARLAMMDDAGVDVQILSARPLPLLADEATAVRMAQIVNDRNAAIVSRHPDRFRAYIELPLPHLDAAIREYERCRDELGFEYVNVLASHGTAAAVAEEFDPLFDRLDEAGAIVFFHPRVSGLCSPLLNDYNLTAPVGPALEDTVLVAQMIVRQFPIRFPNLRIVIPHLGGMLPIYLNRMDNQMARALPDLPEKPSDLVRRLWFDTLVHGSSIALRAAVDSFGVDRLVTGSDYPALQEFDGYRSSFDYVRHAGLPAESVHQILHVNGPRLYGLG